MELKNLDYSSEGAINKDISYELSALLDADSLFYGVVDYSRRLKKARHITVDKASVDEVEIDYSIRKTKIGILSPIFTLVPAQEFSSSHASELIYHNHSVKEQENVLIRNDYSEKFNIRVVYAISKHDVEFLTSSFKSPSLHHFLSASIDDLDISSSEICFRAIVFSGKLTILVHQENRLLLANTYEYIDTATFLYFITLVFKQLGLSQSEQLITISGYIDQSDEMITTLRRYYAHVQFVDHSVLIDSETPRHLYHPLYCISKCV